MAQAEQEREIRDLLRRAEQHPLKINLRRDALNKLIDLAHSQYPNLKVIAATNLKLFIKDFPELEDDAINAVYDLCEDQVTQVRIKGYAAIVDVSKEQNKWVKRNADVLIQLLQSDEPEEVTFVKRALIQHLDMDPAVTLGVLCDQIVPPNEPSDEEERAIRDRLRSLVLAFMTGEAKRAITERHTSTAGSPAEETLVNGMLKAVTKLAPRDIDIIVKEILLSMASFKPLSARGKQLLDVILKRAKSELKTDLPPGSEHSSLEHSQYFLDLASFISVEKRIAHPSHLVRFYYTSLVPKMILLRLTADAQSFVISSVGKTLSACEDSSSAQQDVSSAEDPSVRRQVPDICAALLQFIAEEDFGGKRPWPACEALLRICAKRKTDSKWVVPSHLAAILRNLQAVVESQQKEAKVDGMQEIHSLIRSLFPPPSKPKPAPPAPAPTPAPAPAAPPANTDVSKGMTSTQSGHHAGKNDRRIMNVTKRKDDLNLALPPRPPAPTAGPATSMRSSGGSPRSPAPYRERHSANGPQARPRSSTAPGTSAPTNGRSSPADDLLRAGKRAKKGGGSEGGERYEAPSLLSRLGASTSESSVGGMARQPMQPSIPAKRRFEAAPISASRSQPGSILREDPDKDPVGGYSIKGAAKAANRPSPPRGVQQQSSLLDRMREDDDEWESGGRKKKKRTRT